MKSRSIIFYVQRSTDFALENDVIPFDIEVLNIGGAMNSATGVFTAPVNGIYHFEFSTLKEGSNEKYVWVNLQVNGVGIGSSYTLHSRIYSVKSWGPSKTVQNFWYQLMMVIGILILLDCWVEIY